MQAHTPHVGTFAQDFIGTENADKKRMLIRKVCYNPRIKGTECGTSVPQAQKKRRMSLFALLASVSICPAV